LKPSVPSNNNNNNNINNNGSNDTNGFNNSNNNNSNNNNNNTTTAVSSATIAAPVLARGWGNHIDFLLHKSAMVPKQDGSGEKEVTVFEVVAGFKTEFPVLAIDWLGEKTLGYLDTKLKLHIYDTLSMTQLEVFDVRSQRLIFATYIRDTTTLPSVDGDKG
jgi:hypothetical protein